MVHTHKMLTELLLSSYNEKGMNGTFSRRPKLLCNASFILKLQRSRHMKSSSTMHSQHLVYNQNGDFPLQRHLLNTQNNLQIKLHVKQKIKYLQLRLKQSKEKFKNTIKINYHHSNSNPYSPPLSPLQFLFPYFTISRLSYN